MLDMFYRDPKRWAFTFQTYAFLSRTQAAVQQLRAGDAAYYASAAAGPDDAAADGERASEKRIPPSYVFERSLYSDKHCFATNCFKTGLFNQAEWTVYNDYHAFIMVRALLLCSPSLAATSVSTSHYCFRCIGFAAGSLDLSAHLLGAASLYFSILCLRTKTLACALTASFTFVQRPKPASIEASAAAAPRKQACRCRTSVNCTLATKIGSFRRRLPLRLLPFQQLLRPQDLLKQQQAMTKRQR